VSKKLKIVELDCGQVRNELVDYMEGDLTPQLRAQIDWHLEGCQHCTAIYDGVRNIVQLVGNEKALELPAGLSKRLYQRLLSRVQ
jgi:predicted anti-sigma-YlaC factor YlaD